MSIGSWWGDLAEKWGINNKYSSAGKARTERDIQGERNKEAVQQAQGGSAEQAQKEMDFQERMSNTQVQRRTEDLQAAGLNPVLAAGSAASSPSGAMGNAGMAQAGQANTSGSMGGTNEALGELMGAAEMMNLGNKISNKKMNEVNSALGSLSKIFG